MALIDSWTMNQQIKKKGKHPMENVLRKALAKYMINEGRSIEIIDW